MTPGYDSVGETRGKVWLVYMSSAKEMTLRRYKIIIYVRENALHSQCKEAVYFCGSEPYYAAQ